MRTVHLKGFRASKRGAKRLKGMKNAYNGGLVVEFEVGVAGIGDFAQGQGTDQGKPALHGRQFRLMTMFPSDSVTLIASLIGVQPWATPTELVVSARASTAASSSRPWFVNRQGFC